MGYLVFAVLLVSAALFAIGCWGDSASCGAKWPDKFQPQWGIMTGCTIIGNDGVRIPAENYRVL